MDVKTLLYFCWDNFLVAVWADLRFFSLCMCECVLCAGCVLGDDMGLGKTVQVCALYVVCIGNSSLCVRSDDFTHT